MGMPMDVRAQAIAYLKAHRRIVQLEIGQAMNIAELARLGHADVHKVLADITVEEAAKPTAPMPPSATGGRL